MKQTLKNETADPLCSSVIVSISIYHNYQDFVAKSDMLISQLYNNPSGSSRYFSVRIPTQPVRPALA